MLPAKANSQLVLKTLSGRGQYFLRFRRFFFTQTSEAKFGKNEGRPRMTKNITVSQQVFGWGLVHAACISVYVKIFRVLKLNAK